MLFPIGNREAEYFLFLIQDLKGKESMILEVRPTNDPAVALYKNTGFQTIGVRKGYYADTREDALVMRLVL